MNKNTMKIALCGVTKPTAASGRYREAEEGKVTSGQEGFQPVAVRADNFSGQDQHIR